MGENISVSEQKIYMLQEKSKINTNDENPSLSVKYHESEIEQNGIIIKNAIKMMWVGCALLTFGLVLSVITNSDWITLIPGAFVDIFSGGILYLVNKSSESKQRYFVSR